MRCLAAWTLIFSCAACGAQGENALLGKTRVLRLDGPELTVSGIYLFGKDGERLLQLLSHPEVRTLKIGYVPGGLALVGYKMANRLSGKTVTVTGPCASACANAVTAAASISFAPVSVGDMPPMLIFHGLLRKTGEKIENAQEANKLFAKRLNRRFPYLTPDQLDEALRYPAAGINGLVVTRPASGGVDFSLCQPWPTRCRSVYHSEQNSL